MRIAFIAYHFSEDLDKVGAQRSIALAELLEERENELVYVTRNAFGPLGSASFLFWCVRCWGHLATAGFDRVYASCGPFWHLPFIWLACRIASVPFVIDFRDPWSFNYRRLMIRRGASLSLAARLFLSRCLEKRLYADCMRFWVCTPGMRQMYANLFDSSEKIDLVPNGYRFNSRDLALPRDTSDTVRLVCLGKFAEYGYNRAESVLEDIERRSRATHTPIELSFVGSGPETKKAVEELGLQDRTAFHPRMPYIEAVRLAARADMGLCLMRDEQFDLGTKVFDYIGLGLTIYDSFQRSSNARRFLKPFLSSDLTKKPRRPDWAKRERYQRAAQFQRHLSTLDDKPDGTTSWRGGEPASKAV